MHRPLLILSVALLGLPAGLSAQEPPRSKEVKEAEKFIASAMLTNDTAEKKIRLQRALNPLQRAMVDDPRNARVWLAAGQVYAGIGAYAAADSAFDKALELYPTFAAEIHNDRLRAWGEIFNMGVAAMDARNYDAAITHFELAEVLYADRPESKMNLGALYAMKNDAAKAEKMFRGVIALVTGPGRANLTPEEATQWQRFSEMAHINAAQMIGQTGVTAFEAQRYDDAIAAFREARKLNPHARDYSYNLAQSIYAKAARLEETRSKLVDEEKAARTKKDVAGAKAKADEIAQVSKQLSDFYAEIEPLAAEARALDPNNEDLFLLLMRSYRIRADVATDAALKASLNARVNDLLKLHESMTVELTNVLITPGRGEVSFKGELFNLLAKPGAPVKVHVTLVSLTGATVGETDIVVNAPAVKASVPVQGVVKVTGEVAGWRYQVVP